MAGSESTLEILTERLDHLERTTRRWKWITTGVSCLTLVGVIAVGLGVFVAFGIATDDKRSLTTPQLRLQQRLDSITGGLLTAIDDGADMILRSEAGIMKVAATRSLYIELTGGNGRPRAVLAVADDGEPYLNLYDADGTLRVTLGRTELRTIRTGATEKRPVGSLVFFDRAGKVVWSAP